jgi:hypothetical protein
LLPTTRISATGSSVAESVGPLTSRCGSFLPNMVSGIEGKPPPGPGWAQADGASAAPASAANTANRHWGRARFRKAYNSEVRVDLVRRGRTQFDAAEKIDEKRKRTPDPSPAHCLQRGAGSPTALRKSRVEIAELPAGGKAGCSLDITTMCWHSWKPPVASSARSEHRDCTAHNRRRILEWNELSNAKRHVYSPWRPAPTPSCLSAAWAAARRAMGTRNGLQET